MHRTDEECAALIDVVIEKYESLLTDQLRVLFEKVNDLETKLHLLTADDWARINVLFRRIQYVAFMTGMLAATEEHDLLHGSASEGPPTHEDG